MKSKNIVGFARKMFIVVIASIIFVTNIEAKTYSKNQCKKYAYSVVTNKYHWSIEDYNNLVKLWNRESSWNAKAYNKRSGTCGIPQAKPCSKMRSYGKDYRNNCKIQISWGLNYIKKRYKNPTNAWKHFQKTHWY